MNKEAMNLKERKKGMWEGLEGEKGQGNYMISKCQPMLCVYFSSGFLGNVSEAFRETGLGEVLSSGSRCSCAASAWGEISLHGGCVICTVMCKGIPVILSFDANLF